MKKFMLLLLASVALCCCEKDSDTTQLCIQLFSDDIPMQATIKVMESDHIIHDFVIREKNSAIPMNPGNYQLSLYTYPNPQLRYREYFQIAEGHTTTVRRTFEGCKISIK